MKGIYWTKNEIGSAAARISHRYVDTEIAGRSTGNKGEECTDMT